MTIDDRIEKRLNEGLLGQWYVVAKSADLKAAQPLAVKRMGRNLVLWRDTAGKGTAWRTIVRTVARRFRAVSSSTASCRAATTV